MLLWWQVTVRKRSYLKKWGLERGQDQGKDLVLDLLKRTKMLVLQEQGAENDN